MSGSTPCCLLMHTRGAAAVLPFSRHPLGTSDPAFEHDAFRANSCDTACRPPAHQGRCFCLAAKFNRLAWQNSTGKVSEMSGPTPCCLLMHTRGAAGVLP